jgi:hypothetical protein
MVWRRLQPLKGARAFLLHFPVGRLCSSLSGTVVSRFHRHGDTAVMSSFVLCLISPSSNHFGFLFVVLVLEGPRESKYVRPNEIMVRSVTSDGNCAHCCFIGCKAVYLGAYLPTYMALHSRRRVFMARSAARLRVRLPYPTDNVGAFMTCVVVAALTLPNVCCSDLIR